MAEAKGVIKEFLFSRMYRHWRQNACTTRPAAWWATLFAILHGDTGTAAR